MFTGTSSGKSSPEQNFMKTIAYLFLLFAFVAQLSAKPETWPVYAFQNGVHLKTTAERIKVLKELGYDGIGSAKLSQSDLALPQRLKLYDEAGLKLFSFYVGGRLGPKGHSYGKEISQAIKDLKGRKTILELYVQGSKKANTDDQGSAAEPPLEKTHRNKPSCQPCQSWFQTQGSPPPGKFLPQSHHEADIPFGIYQPHFRPGQSAQQHCK
jgi:hypothetical protein